MIAFVLAILWRRWGILALTAVQMFGLGVVGDALAGQRVIAQRTFERVRRLELEAGIEPSHYEPGSEAADHATAEGHARRGRALGRDRSEDHAPAESLSTFSGWA